MRFYPRTRKILVGVPIQLSTGKGAEGGRGKEN